MRKFAKTPTYQTIEILGQPAIYTDYRIEHTSVPQGFCLYEIRHSDEDWGIPCQLARNIAVNFYGTIITNTPIQLPPDGLLDFDYRAMRKPLSPIISLMWPSAMCLSANSRWQTNGMTG